MKLPTPKQRGKHYQCQRAKADGWKIEMSLRSATDWVVLSTPGFNDDCEYRIVPDENGWLPWYATEESSDGPFTNLLFTGCYTTVDFISELSPVGNTCAASKIVWHKCTDSITHYRPHKERKLVKTVKHYDDGTTEEN